MAGIPITELFSSIQGEGPYVGVRQIFLRLPKCNLTCPYCDTDTEIPRQFRVETVPGSRKFDWINNSISIEELVEFMKMYDFSIHHSISITGGEPLLWSKELRVLLALLQESGIKIYLETNGTLPDQLLQVLPLIDIISMDIKLPMNSKDYWEVHETFLRLSLQKEVFVKIVVDAETAIDTLREARNLIARVAPQIVTILQPVTKTRAIKSPAPNQLIEWQSFLLQKLSDVRVIPQTHVFMGQL